MADRVVTLVSKDEVAISALRTAAGQHLVAITGADNAVLEDQSLSTVWATPSEARLLAAIVDVADLIDNIDDGTPPPEGDITRRWRHTQALLHEVTAQLADADVKLDWVRAQHTRSATAHVDDIHHGLTPVYDDGCVECGQRWPCETIRKLDE